MMNSKDSKKMDEIAEKIALDDFDKLEEQHEFSDTYTHKKKLFMEEIRQKIKQHQAKRKRKSILIATACLLIGMPTTVFGAVKAYDMIVQKQNYEVNVSVTNKAFKKNDNWYKLKIDYLPENMEAIDESEMKYSFKDNYAQGGFSFLLWRLGENSDFSTMYSSNFEEMEINGRKAVVVSRDTGSDDLAFDRQIFLLFKEEGMMLQSYIGTDVSDEQMMTVMKNISLEATSEENAHYTMDYDEFLANQEKAEAEEPTEFSVVPLKKDSKQLFNVGQPVPVTLEQVETGIINKLDYVIEKVEVFDSIQDFKGENFNDSSLKTLTENQALDETKKLLPYKRDVYKVGDGKDSINKLIESPSVNLKFVYLTTEVKNNSKQATEEIYMHPSLQVLKPEKNAWNYAGEDGIAEESIMTGEVDYLAPHGDGKGFYNIGILQPGQTMQINLGYFVDEDKLDSIFLDVFHYSGFGKTEDMNADDRWWIDIRQ
ncbi:anti-sigma factor [Lederbergia sp. NSJ-179]|uniref:anti-sigma factor n=1 Tax=Lederbergia sp. NSJ-179 TaxID=2931402 RepID=UPI001FCFE9E7|nr:anti-sigma factor [Lederbergia sp. NSJ-179]MCJ7839329.1 anti-sigma factor [Lederbergia sp. NSJ-179]